jgi:hypothetical protein
MSIPESRAARSGRSKIRDVEPELEGAAEQEEESSLPDLDEAGAGDFDAGAGPLAAGRDAILRHARLAPAGPGVYRMIDGKGDVLYVGKAKSIRKRVLSYARPTGHDSRIERMIAATSALEFVTTTTETEALLLEANLIKRLRPRFNVLLRDDKSFPYILRATITARLRPSGPSTAPSPPCNAHSCCVPAPTPFSKAARAHVCCIRSSAVPDRARARSISPAIPNWCGRPIPSSTVAASS